ncbi:hypothetical protein ACQKGL_23220 [Ensifer adhaerens]|uniref:hypothetical protein n=1 Tax=Ensifer adhaerens TaxID=106592 RepID=UPI003CFD2318
MIKGLAILAVLAAMIFFVLGGILVWNGVFSVGNYGLYGGIVGSIASILSLLGFASPRLTSDDIINVENELVQKLADAAKSVKDSEKMIATNKEAIEKLERDRLNVELLVRQASIKVFLEEKLKNLSEEIEQRVLSDKILSDYLIEYSSSKERVRSLDGEIGVSQHAELIEEIIGEVRPRDRKMFVEFAGLKIDVSPVLNAAEMLASSLTKSILK